MSLVYSLNAREQMQTTNTRRNFSRARGPNAGVASARRADRAAIQKMKLVSSDSECMARLATGDANALRELYQRHGRALLRFSSAMCRSRQAAEDMVHDTFVALMREPICFDPAQGTVFGYLCGVLRHRVSRHFRQQKRWVALDMDSDTAPVQASDSQCPSNRPAATQQMSSAGDPARRISWQFFRRRSIRAMETRRSERSCGKPVPIRALLSSQTALTCIGLSLHEAPLPFMAV